MNGKDVIYIDAEDEITGVIDKVTSSKSKIVALVLPKRAPVFQSIVNLKLLKKRADSLKKRIVLVTSDASLLPMIGVVGLHVAKTLQDQPSIPKTPDMDDDGPVDLDDKEDEAELDNSKSVGELAGLTAVGSNGSKSKPMVEDDAIEVDNTTPDDKAKMVGSAGAEAATKAGKKGKKDKSLKVPDFNKFRNILLIGVAAIIILVAGYIYAFNVLPKADIVIQTNTSNANSNLSLTLSSTQTTLDPVNDIVPAKVQTVQKSQTSSSVTTTGQKNIGTSATGTVTVTNDSSNTSGYTIPAGTVFTDPSGNYSYTSNTAETIDGFSGGKGKFTQPSVAIPVTASQIGSSYNISSQNNFTTSDPTLSSDGYEINGTAMTGGSSQTVQVVAQADVNSAESQLSSPNSSSEQQSLETSLKQAGLTPIVASFSTGTPTYTPSADVGSQANSVTVTANYTYTMYGVQQSDLQTLVDNNVNQQINPSTQSILDSGVSSASYTYISNNSNSVVVTMAATSIVGPKINITTLTKQVAGEKSGDIKSSIEQIPGVTNVTVKYSPFWVGSTPKNTKKITITLEKKDGSAT